jgi:hypothetical protein
MPDIERGWMRPQSFNFASPVICTQAGGGKPRVCAASFERNHSGFHIKLSADVTAEIHQREDDTLRAIGRACVPAGLAFAREIGAFAAPLEHDFLVLPSGDLKWRFEFHRTTHNGALGRRVSVQFYVITPGGDDKPDVDRQTILAAASALKKVSEDLHGSLA